ncbi:peptidylprolyl isomerase [Xenophilus arseniciresistens]|uniref:Peptidylprolyl isomerase n=1 Tax=Xenophilus arseniciresistens TaxID=1283306 RepID=A0AAE3N4Z3_9BURK|nr:peptidylprolyl isomerase [Xenophilus arseniciresistens]MDA7414993.1 peptidylprolyl isomerase [Xenophilus arseniciresistens]
MSLFDSHTLRGGLGLLLAWMVGSAAAQAPAPAAGGPVIARMGAIGIQQSEVDLLLQNLAPAEREQLKGNRAGLENWLRQRVASEALLREAQQKRWAERPEVKARVDAAVREVTARLVGGSYLDSVSQVPAGYPSAAELQAAYERARPGLELPVRYRVAQIYLATQPGADAAAVAAVRAQAQQLAAQARSADFAALAREKSQEPRSAAQGGEVGALPLAQMLPEIRESVTRLQPGQVSEALQSPTGFHVVKLLETLPARTATLQEVQPRLQAALREQRRQQLVAEHMNKLAPAASVNIDSAALDAALTRIE